VVSSSTTANDGAGVVGSLVIGSWAVEAPPPPEEEGWSPGQATCASNSSMLISVEKQGVGASDGVAEGASDLFPLAFLDPLKVIVGSSRFQQFFLI